MKKKIIFVIGLMGNGGAERVISILSDQFVNQGYDVSILAIYGDKRNYELSEKISYQFIQCKSNKKILRLIERLFKIRNILKSYQDMIIISFLADVNIYVLLSNLFLKNKIIISERNDPRNDPKSNIIRNLRDITYYLCDGIVFQTKDAKEYFSRKIQKKSIIIANPLKNNLPERYSGLREKRIVTVARLNVQKNIPMLIDAFEIFQKNNENYKLEIYGEGPLREELDMYIKSKGLEKKVILKGFSNNIHDCILKAKMFVLVSDYEGISNAMIEALAIGIPVICTDCPVGGGRMFIENGKNGILIPVRDVNALQCAMQSIVDNDELAQNLSKNSLKIRKQLDSKKIMKQWKDFILKYDN